MTCNVGPVSLRYGYSPNYKENEVLANRTVPLGGMLRVIAAIVIFGVSYNCAQKLDQFLQTKHATKTVAPAKPAQKSNVNVYYYPVYSPTEKTR